MSVKTHRWFLQPAVCAVVNLFFYFRTSIAQVNKAVSSTNCLRQTFCVCLRQSSFTLYIRRHHKFWRRSKLSWLFIAKKLSGFFFFSLIVLTFLKVDSKIDARVVASFTCQTLADCKGLWPFLKPWYFTWLAKTFVKYLSEWTQLLFLSLAFIRVVLLDYSLFR